MAPGGDWLARKILGGAIVDEMDRRNGAAERAFKSIAPASRRCVEVMLPRLLSMLRNLRVDSQAITQG